jgi:Flp pilus assembly protein TadG
VRRLIGQRDNSGSAAVEIVVLIPLLMVFVVLAVAFGRFETTRIQVIAAARAAVEAASVSSSPDQAQSAASEAAKPAFLGSLGNCRSLIVETNTEDFRPGGTVTVTVSCTLDLSDLGAPGLPGSSVVSATQVAPIDPYRVVS